MGIIIKFLNNRQQNYMVNYNNEKKMSFFFDNIMYVKKMTSFPPSLVVKLNTRLCTIVVLLKLLIKYIYLSPRLTTCTHLSQLTIVNTRALNQQ